MTIANYQNKLIKIQSDFLDDLVNNPANYTKIDLTGKMGCNGTPITQTIQASDLTNAGWVVDLNEAVSLGNTIYHLFIKNYFSQKEFDIITASIDLSYVQANCTSPTNDCTLQTFSTHFAPIFKAQIDSWFSTKSIPSNVTVTFVGNKMVVTGLVSPFVFSKAQYNNSTTNIAPYLEQPFGYNVVDNGFFISDGAIYVEPSFFSDTTLLDGIYVFTIKYTKAANAGYTQESTCSFIDIKTRCLVAQTLNTILETGFKDDAVNLFYLHYGLVNGSNCGCNCDDLCNVYNELLDLLSANSTLNNTSTQDCGC